MKHRPPGRPDEIPYHQYWVRSYRRVVWVNLLAIIAVLIALLVTRFWWAQLIDAVILMGLTVLAWEARRNWRKHSQAIWSIETGETLEGMMRAGLYNSLDALMALRDGPRPAGWRRKEWLEFHDELIEQRRADGTDHES